MYAIIESGSKQYRIEEGDVIDVELLTPSEEKAVEFKNVLFLNDGTKIFIGAPYIENCSIKAELLSQVKGPKVIAFKYKKRKNFRKKIGHRQKYTRVKITEIKIG